MTGNTKFEMSSDSPEDSGLSGNYSNGQRGNYPGHSLDRSGSFREGSEGRSFSSGTGPSKSNYMAMADLPQLAQVLNLEPISMGDQKYTRAGELRRALGFSFGNVSEDNSFGAAHSKPPPTLATDELKRFRANVHEGSVKARTRVRRLDDSIIKVSKYLDAMNPRKQQATERSGGSNILKMGTQSHRSLPDIAAQKLEERNKNMVLNKRARTPIGDMRAEGRSNGFPRQHLAAGKDKDATKEGSSDLVEEKIRRLPAGGEGWDKKMKRKRSVSSVTHRPLDGDGELKRNMHGRLANDSSTQNSDSHGFRSGGLNGSNGTNKLDGSPSPGGLSSRMTPKSELEKASLSRELTGMNKERLLQKGNAKLNMREDSHLFSPGTVTKGKASRAHRMGPAVGNSSPSFSRMSGASEDWEQPLNVNKVHSLAGVSNRKRPLPTESPSPPMAQWVGQRPQKISRNRRTNIVSPTSNHDEVQISPDGCGSDFSPRIPGGMNGSLPVRNIGNSTQQLKMKLENAQSPARLSECEENSAGENRLKDKTLSGSEVEERGISGHQHASPTTLFPKKSKFVGKDDVGDGVRRQGRTGRGSSISRTSMSPMREKLDSPAIGKPVRRPGSEKNGSKSGRPPLKKHSDRKGLTRLGSVPNSNSPDFAGESDDDHEELLAAAQFACNASYNCSSSTFWKRMEPLFYVRNEDKLFLDEQLKSAEELPPSLKEMSGMGDNAMNHGLKIEPPESGGFVSRESKQCALDNGLKDSSKAGILINHFKEHDSSYGGSDPEKWHDSLTPLYQRVLSALVVEEEFDDFEENNFGSNACSSADRDDPFIVADRISCNGNAFHSGFSTFEDPMHDEIEDGNCSYNQPRTGPAMFESDSNGSLAIAKNSAGGFSSETRYDQMCMDEKLIVELQNIGLYPDTVPDLSEGDDELINEGLIQLKKQLSQQVGKKKVYLEGVHKAIEERKEVEEREIEQCAMNKLTEAAYRKLLATRGITAAKMGISKVPRHVALAFIRRTLVRCRKFEDAGKSCFTEPALRDALFAVPNNNPGALEEQDMRDARISGPEQLDRQSDKPERSPFDSYEALPPQSDHAFAKNGPIVNRGKKKEVLLDDVSGNASLRSTPILGSSLLGGAKGKRSERDGSKAGRTPITNLRGERKTKAKPKQKASQMSTHPVQPSIRASIEVANNGSNRRQEGLNILDSSKESKDPLDFSNLPLDFNAIEDINVATELDGHQDLSSWLNFDEDGLQDHDSMGLEIPMDDLSELNIAL